MERRKIQLIAGTTYSISLPKEWVKKNNLREKSELYIIEKSDRSLILLPHHNEEKNLSEISLNVDDYVEEINQILFALYYLGIEKISLYSKKLISKMVKSRIRKTLTHMSGTEITFEDEQKMTIMVLLDKSKVDIKQLMYRISLIIELSLKDLTEELNIDEIKINENEIDRLYHLLAKIISLSLIDSNVLLSCNIRNVSLIPSYFLISKKLENIGDNINHLAEYLKSGEIALPQNKEVFSFISSEISRSIKHIIGDSNKMFKKTKEEDLNKLKLQISKIKDITILDYLKEIVRYIIDIEEELINVSFYNNLMADSVI